MVHPCGGVRATPTGLPPASPAAFRFRYLFSLPRIDGLGGALPPAVAITRTSAGPWRPGRRGGPGFLAACRRVKGPSLRPHGSCDRLARFQALGGAEGGFAGRLQETSRNFAGPRGYLWLPFSQLQWVLFELG